MKARETIRARWTLVIFVFVVLPLMLAAHDALAWEGNVEFEYNPSNSPIPKAEMEDAVEYALWSLTSRTTLDAEYIGLTGNTETEGSIVIQWAYLDYHNAVGGLNLGQASRWARTSDGKHLRATIALNIYHAKKVDTCFRQLLLHEIIHTLGSMAHTDYPEDVMFQYQGKECRYSPSLSDLATMPYKIDSCHVELTPDKDLEVLDHNGKRISLFAWSLGKWGWKAIYRNPLPKHCSGVHVAGAEAYAEVKSFGGESGVYRFRISDSDFVRF